MNVGLVLLAAALLVAPWTGPAQERLRELGAAGTDRRVGPSPRGAEALRGAVSLHGAGAQRGAVALRAVAAWFGPRRGDAAPADALARLLDLLAAALVAGLPTHAALSATADALEATHAVTAVPLRAAAARVQLGAGAAEAWAEVPGAEQIAPIASVLARATDGGGSVRAALDHAAQRLRSEADAAAVSRAERAAVLVAGPLGLCFLPAFVCLGVVPVVIGLADGMLPGVLP